MDLNLTGKRALVSGSTAGIGLAIAATLAGEGAEVVIAGRNKEKLEEARKTIIAKTGAQAGKVITVVTDLGTADGAKQVFESVPEIDILVNNLGIYESRPFFEIEDSDWLRIFEVNVLSGSRLSRLYMPGMLARNWGRIIFISSDSGIMTPPEMIHYGMTKSAQLAITRGLAELTKGSQVTVNAVLPGPTMSEGIVGFLKSVASNPNLDEKQAEKEFFEKHRGSSLVSRLLDPTEVANLIAYVASPLSSATNGAALKAEGGLVRSIF